MVNRPMVNVFIAPLNWGLGHATRCVPLIDRYLAEGAKVTIGGDGESLDWLRRRYPDLPAVELAPLRLHYSKGRRQVWTLLLQLPHILCWLIRDHRRMNELQREHHFDLIISDNRFALYLTSPSVYITHQLRIRLPRPWQWLEPLAQRVHACIINRYSELWVPDYPDYPGLAGVLSHIDRQPISNRSAIDPKYIGPLSRFSNYPLPLESEASALGKGCPQDGKGASVLLLSGLEPQRSLFREWAQRQYPGVEVIEGCVDDEYVASRLCSAETIIARSGYSTIMDLEALGLLDRALLIPTPGQPEQEYLAKLTNNLVQK